MLGVSGTYVRSMLIHVRLLEAMLGPSSGHAELMLLKPRTFLLNPFKPLPGPKGAHHFWIVSGPLLSVGAYVGPMLIHVRLLEAMLAPCSAMLSLC